MGDFEKFKLKNGLTVLIEHRKLPVASIMAAVKYGSAYETDKLKGIAHFLEHSVFKGTKTKSQKEIVKIIEKHGGEINAATAEDITFFYSRLPSRYLNLGVNILSDITLNPRLSEDSIEQERKVILQEINLYHDRPELYVSDKIKSMLYEYPFGMSALGNKGTVSNILRKDLLNLHSCYNPRHMILSIVGNIDLDLKILEKQFHSRSKKTIGNFKVQERLKPASIFEHRPGLEQSHVCFGYKMPSLSKKERYASEIFNSVLGGGMSSWLWQEIREKRSLAYTVSSHLSQGKDFGYGLVYAGVKKGSEKETLEIIKNCINKFQKLSKRDFEETKEELIGHFELMNERSDRTALSLIQEEIVRNAREHYSYPERISKIKLEDVKRIADLKNFASVVLY
jgi:predicted Zn-dependent peptidase